MSNQLAVFQKYTPDQLQLIKSTVAKNATNDELGLFLYRCDLLELNPLKPGQIHFVKYGTGAGTIVVGIEGFRSIAARTGKLSGIKRGAIKDANGKLLGAWAEVYRTDWTHCAREEVPLIEYDKGNSTWKNMPETMIKKVAEAAALRMAFPDNLGGVYETAEMDQAAPVKHVNSVVVNTDYVVPAKQENPPIAAYANVQPEQTDAFPAPFTDTELQNDQNNATEQNGSYVCQIGKKYIGQTLDQMGVENVESYKNYLVGSSKKDGKPLTGLWFEFVVEAEKYTATRKS